MSAQKQATWGGRFAEGPSKIMQSFSESVSFDYVLAPFDILGSLAHASMLHKVGILTKEELASIEEGLKEIGKDIEEGRFSWDLALEDVHMNIEQALSKKVPAAAKLQTGRSRNDQVATDMRLYLRWAVEQLLEGLAESCRSLVDLADKYQDVLIPGYTHLQRGQPISAAHHLLAYVEMLGRDRQRFASMLPRINVCPLGSGALAGSTLPLNREWVATKLGFVDEDDKPQVTHNSLDAVSDRDLFLEFAAYASICGLHLSRFSEDFILWSSSEFSFVRLPDRYTTGSSLMPQKKNPDALELIRGKSARLQGNLQTLQSLVKNLPLTYNRDLQEDKPPLFDSFATLRDCLIVLSDLVPGITFQTDACRKAVSDPLLLATDLADYLVERGVPFRQAHHQVGALVALSEQLETLIDQIPLEKAVKVAPGLGEDWTKVFDLKVAMKKRKAVGMPGPDAVRAEVSRWNDILR